jgi:hypothetical protein
MWKRFESLRGFAGIAALLLGVMLVPSVALALDPTDAPPLPFPDRNKLVKVKNIYELADAVKDLSENANVTIALYPSTKTYNLEELPEGERRLNIGTSARPVSRVTIRGYSQDPTDIVLDCWDAEEGIGIYIQYASNIRFAYMTIADGRFYSVLINPEKVTFSMSGFYFYRCIIVSAGGGIYAPDGGIMVVRADLNNNRTVNQGRIEYCTIGYPTGYYVGWPTYISGELLDSSHPTDGNAIGVYLEGGSGWSFQHNLFLRVCPRQKCDDYTGWDVKPRNAAIFLTKGANDITIDSNWFVNCEVAIASGGRDENDGSFTTYGSTTECAVTKLDIKNNMINRDMKTITPPQTGPIPTWQGNHPIWGGWVDDFTPVILYDAKQANIYHNTIRVPDGRLANAIEMRGLDSGQNYIKNNLVSAPIYFLDRATGVKVDNYEGAFPTFTSSQGDTISTFFVTNYYDQDAVNDKPLWTHPDLHLNAPGQFTTLLNEFISPIDPMNPHLYPTLVNVSGTEAVIDKVPVLADAGSDYDRGARPFAYPAEGSSVELEVYLPPVKHYANSYGGESTAVYTVYKPWYPYGIAGVKFIGPRSPNTANWGTVAYENEEPTTYLEQPLIMPDGSPNPLGAIHSATPDGGNLARAPWIAGRTRASTRDMYASNVRNPEPYYKWVFTNPAYDSVLGLNAVDDKNTCKVVPASSTRLADYGADEWGTGRVPGSGATPGKTKGNFPDNELRWRKRSSGNTPSNDSDYMTESQYQSAVIKLREERETETEEATRDSETVDELRDIYNQARENAGTNTNAPKPKSGDSEKLEVRPRAGDDGRDAGTGMGN